MKKSKKLLAIFLALCMVGTMFTALPTIASAASVTPTLKLGDYIQVGEYYGQPILWRVVSFEKVSGYDDAGSPIIDSTDTKTEATEGYLPLLLADKILTIKAFDACGYVTTGSHNRGYNGGSYRKSHGSNCWADSNIRDWMNANTAEVNWSCGNRPDAAHMYNGQNAYDNESGFLYGFDNLDKSLIQPVTQKSLLDRYEYSDMSKYGTGYHRYSDSIGNVVQNYSTAYAKQVTDKVFLLDAQQINTVYNNSGILGSNYYIGEPTVEAVANSNYKNDSLQIGEKWNSWLRSPGANGSSHCVRYVGLDGNVDNDNASRTNAGVRPAFFADVTAFTNFTGDGKSNNPYRFQKCTVTYRGDYEGSKTVLHGGDVTLPTPPKGYTYTFVANGELWDGKNITADVTVTVIKDTHYSGSCGDNLTWSLDTSTGVLNITGTGDMYDYTGGYEDFSGYEIQEEYTATGVVVPGWRMAMCNGAWLNTEPTAKISEYNGAPAMAITGTSCGYTSYINRQNFLKFEGDKSGIGSSYRIHFAFHKSSAANGFGIKFAMEPYDQDTYYYLWFGGSKDEGNAIWTFSKVESAVRKLCESNLTYTAFNSRPGTITDGVVDIVVNNGDISWSITGTRYQNIAFSDAGGYTDIKPTKTESSKLGIAFNATNDNAGAVTYLTEFGIENVEPYSAPWRCYHDVLKTVIIDDGVTSIGDAAFYGCDSLTSVTIPDSVTSIGDAAFKSCRSLAGVTMGSGVTSIRNGAFSGCNLQDVYYMGTKADKSRIAIGGYNNKLLDATWHYASRITVTGFVKPVELRAFCDSGTVLIGYYDDRNILINEETLPVSATVTATPPDDYAYAKVMWWKDADNLVPVCEAKKIEN